MTASHSLPQGFQAAGISCGLKTQPVNDLALFYSEHPCVSAGVFTQNNVVGAPVKVSRDRVGRTSSRAVVINSGNANACTGERGLEDALWMTSLVAGGIGCDAEDVLLCSTGVIGHFLPRDILQAGIPQVVEALTCDASGFEQAARGMMTTDTFHKQSVRQISLDGKTVRVSGAAKGAAMIAPNMATMLAVVMTDAQLTPEQSQRVLKSAVDDSFNCIIVEGHTSTSDTVLLLANGAAETGSLSEDDLVTLQQAIGEVCQELAQAIIRDAEGAEHFVVVDVAGLRTRDEADRIAKVVCEGALVKTAITGNDPNWGRIVSAAGYAGVPFGEEDVSLKINGTEIYRLGTPTEYDEEAVSKSMKDADEVHIELSFTLGEAATRFWTSDLTSEYVRLNSEYTT